MPRGVFLRARGKAGVVILMEVVGGLSTFIGQFNIIFDDSPLHDELLYQRPYTPLTIALR